LTRLAIHINDAGITLLGKDQIVYREPGFAWLGDDKLQTGNDAFAKARIDPRRIQHRYWSELVTEPLKDSRFAHLSAADLVSRQLEQVWQQAGSGNKSGNKPDPASVNCSLRFLLTWIHSTWGCSSALPAS
jgi:hypothetical protein